MQWQSATESEELMFSNEKYYVTNHDYFNTGGGCMVSIFTVYDRQLNTTRYVIANEEGFSMQTADTISCAEEFEHEELERIIIGAWDWSALTCEPAPWDMLFEDEDWKLYKHCQFEFYKKDCHGGKYRKEISVEWLSPELMDKLTPDCFDWLRVNNVNVETDGDNVFVPQAYTDYLQELSDKKLQAIKDFKQWFDEIVSADNFEERMQRLYDEPITLSFDGKSVELPFDADTYDTISGLLKDVIKEW